MDRVQAFLDHIHEDWANGDTKQAHYVINWITRAIQHPKERQPILVLKMIDDPFCDFLVEAFKSQGSRVITDLGMLLSRPDGFLEKTNFCLIKGLRIDGRELTEEETRDLRCLLTAKRVTLNLRRGKQKEIDNRTKYIVMTEDLKGLV